MSKPTSPVQVFEPLADFLERARKAPPLAWLLPGLIPSFGGVYLYSDPGVGKTWFILSVAKMACRERDVLLVEEEGYVGSLAKRIESLSFPQDARLLIAHQRGLVLNDKESFAVLRAAVAKAHRPIVMLDPLSDLMDGNENDPKDAGAIVRKLKELQRANSCVLVFLLHHRSKAAAHGDGPQRFGSRGSTKFNGWADVELCLSRPSDGRERGQVAFIVTNPKQREDEESPAKRVVLTLGTGTMEIADQSEISGGDDRRRILEAVSGSKAPLCSKNAIDEAAGGNRSQNLRAISALEKSGELLKSPTGNYRVVPLVPNGSQNQLVPGSSFFRKEPGTGAGN